MEAKNEIIAKLRLENSDLLGELREFKNKYKVHEQQIGKLLEDLSLVKEKLRLNECCKFKLEITNDQLECTVRNLQFKIVEIEENHYRVQEQNALLRNDIEEISYQQSASALEMIRKNEEIQNPSIFEGKPLTSIEFIAVVPKSIYLKSTETQVFYNDKGTKTVFCFDAVVKSTLFEYFKGATGKKSVFVCYGFKNINGVVEKFEKTTENCRWSCVEFIETHEKLLQLKKVQKSEIKLYSGIHLRKRNCNYLYTIDVSGQIFQIVDISDTDGNSINTTENLIQYLKSPSKKNIYANLLSEPADSSLVLFNISGTSPLQSLNSANKILSAFQSTSLQTTSLCSIKENNYNLLFLINKYKTQIASLKEQVAKEQNGRIFYEKKIKLKEIELSREIAELQHYTKELKGKNTGKSVLGVSNSMVFASPLVKKTANCCSRSAERPSRIGKPTTFGRTRQNIENFFPDY